MNAATFRREAAGRQPPLLRDVRVWGVAVGLVAIVVWAFWPVLDNAFVDWDDRDNFLENPHYQGFGWTELRWAWTGVRIGVYQPLAWMLLEAEYAIWRMTPSGYHLVSIILHALNAVLLFVLILMLMWRVRPRDAEGWDACLFGAGVATAYFAVHPLRTEVVAWVSCQPYLPCALFYLLSILIYLKALPPDGSVRKSWFWLSFACLVAALLSKAVAVTLPFVLLILDCYPLRRIGGASPGKAIWDACIEKAPHFAASAAFMWIAVAVKPHEPVAAATASVYGLRVIQGLHGIWFYLAKTLVPVNITAFYGSPVASYPLSPWFVVSAATVAAISAIALGLRRRAPALLAAWASYVVVLAPNLGVVKVTSQIAADRYAYVSSMGLVALLAVLLTAVFERMRRRGRQGLMATSVYVFAGVGLAASLSRIQSVTWRNSETLWTHAVRHGGAEVAKVRNNLGISLFQADKLPEAHEQLIYALRLAPTSVEAYNNLGLVLKREGNFSEAEKAFAEAVRLAPDRDVPHGNLGVLLVRSGRTNQGLVHCLLAIEANPENTTVGRIQDILSETRNQIDVRLAPMVQAVIDHPTDRMAVRALREALEANGR